MTIENCKPGTKVHHLRTKENGIIKSVANGLVFVVFYCDDDWDSYRNYTGQSCSAIDLGEGWL